MKTVVIVIVVIAIIGGIILGGIGGPSLSSNNRTITTISTATIPMSNSTLPLAGYQSDLLGFLGQQDIAHAAAIFATFTAAFTFATGFRKKLSVPLGVQTYVIGLTVLFSSATYSAIRLYFYGLLATVVLNHSPTELMNSTSYGDCSQIHVGSPLSTYWCQVYRMTSNYNWFTGTIPAFTLSWVVGSVLAIAVAAYLPPFPSKNNAKAQSLGGIVKDMPKFFKFGFWWAALAWVSEIVISLWYAVVRLIYVSHGAGFSDEEVYCILLAMGGIAWFLVWRSKTGRVNQLSSKIGKLASSLWKRLY